MNVSKTLAMAALLAALTTSLSAGGEMPDNLAGNRAWPEIWGYSGLTAYATGERMAPNGVVFDPLFRSNINLNIGLLPRKKLYLFLEDGFWAQRSAPGITNSHQGTYDFSKREYDITAGVAWNVFDQVELRAAIDTMSNLNRGTSQTEPYGGQNGIELEGRYYFGHANIYDPGLLSFVSIGYAPSQSRVGGDGSEFDEGLFARAYVAYQVPRLRSYFYADVRMVGDPAAVRLVTLDGGIAIRPLTIFQNFELRIGDEFTADLRADTQRNLFYGAIRTMFGGGIAAKGEELLPDAIHVASSPEVWGELGLGTYVAGDRMSPDGVAFKPIAMSDLNFNLGLLPDKKLYVFLESQLWVQRSSSAGLTRNDPANEDLSPREYGVIAGFAWNVYDRFEFRGDAFATNNLNRGGSEIKPSSLISSAGYHDGVQVEGRYYFKSANVYDVGRLNFLSVGYYPSKSLIGGDGIGFKPGLFVRGAGSYDLPRIRSYLFGDARLIVEKGASARLIIVDAGLAARPFREFENLEFRVGNELTADVDAKTTRDLVYGAVRINFSTR